MAQEPKKNNSNILWIGVGGLIGVIIIAVFILLNPFPNPTSTPVSNTDNTSNQQTESTNPSNTNNQASNTTETTNSSTSNETSSDNPASTDSQNDVPEQTSDPNDPWKAQMDDQTRDLLEEIVLAHGGLEKLQQLESFHSIGKNSTTIETQTIDSDVETWIDLPNKLRQSLTISIIGQKIETVVVWNGVKGWQMGPNEQLQVTVQELTPDIAIQAQEDIDFDPLFFLRFVASDGTRYIYTGREDIDGVNTHAVEFYNTLGSKATYYIHPDSLVAIKMLREGGGVVVERYFSDHRDLDGYQIPYVRRNVVTTGNVSSEITYSKIEINSSVASGLFDQPTPE